jgi:peptide/nickel transport system ATP-binding protein
MGMGKFAMSAADSASGTATLRIEHLKVVFRSNGLELPAVDRVSMELRPATCTALLGETGCGKSVLALAIFGLLPVNALVSGCISGLGHADILSLPPKRINGLRGRAMVLIPQNPHGSLNPVFRIEKQLTEAIRLIARKKSAGMRTAALGLLSKTGFSAPDKIAALYPHQLSGGMAQRVLLSAGLAGTPELVIADEPTKGLDDETATRCLHLLKTSFGTAAMLLITHDLKAAAICDEVALMYAGEIVEQGPADKVMADPRHPYARGLVAAHPSNGLHPISGSAPGLSEMPKGCRFHPRCPRADSRCVSEHPSLTARGNRWVRCFHAGY